MRRARKGFSTIELLVVISLVVIMGSAFLYAWNYRDKDRDNSNQKSIKLSAVIHNSPDKIPTLLIGCDWIVFRKITEIKNLYLYTDVSSSMLGGEYPRVAYFNDLNGNYYIAQFIGEKISKIIGPLVLQIDQAG